MSEKFSSVTKNTKKQTNQFIWMIIQMLIQNIILERVLLMGFD